MGFRVINFHNWALEVKDEDTKMLEDHSYASDYPDCMKIVVQKVKPQRDKKITGNTTDRDTAKRWWQFKRPTIALYNTIKQTYVTSACYR